jgi:hypothetical protein
MRESVVSLFCHPEGLRPEGPLFQLRFDFKGVPRCARDDNMGPEIAISTTKSQAPTLYSHPRFRNQ